MAAIATVKVELDLVLRHGDDEARVGTITIPLPVELTTPRGPSTTLWLGSPDDSTKATVASALREAADDLEGIVRPF